MTSQEALLVIDGQQRLTTTTLLITALAKHFEDQGLDEILDAFSERKLRNYYLLNPDEDGERRFKLILSETDKETLLAILQGAPQPREWSERIVENLSLFQELIKEHHLEIGVICQGLAKLVIVDVSLDRTQDNPQLIFESMNSTGLELSQADLIRNFVLMGLEPKLQTELYRNYWRPMEHAFGQGAYVLHFDAFMRHYLTARTGDIPNMREVYAAFKIFSRDFQGDTRELVADIHVYALHYCAMVLGTEENPVLKQAFQDLRELKVDVAYPFLMDVYHDFSCGQLNADEMLKVVRIVESYVFRRAICAIPTNSMNKTFAGMTRIVKKDRYLESIEAAFLTLPSYRRFPGDDEFKRDIKVRDLYNFRSRSYWLRRLENHGRKERVVVEDYTIEHILPQNQDLSVDWQLSLGADWQKVQSDWLHTLGNLTLTGYNSEYSDRPFSYKRDEAIDKAGQPIGFAHSPLKLNIGLGGVSAWNEQAIRDRAERLSTEALSVWASPQLSPEVLDNYRPSSTRRGVQYTIADHPHLTNGLMRNVFKLLRERLLALDPCVSEEILKLYVAFKAETNFVDVIPQAKRLALILNMPFHEIDDPKGRCVDVTNLGRWGNGDVEVSLSNEEDLPYVMGLVRQSFDAQMGASQDV